MPPHQLRAPAPPILDGEFVDLRPLTPEHAALTLEWRLSDRARFLNRGARTAAEQATWIAARPPGEFNFIIALKNGAPVGTVALVNVDPRHRRAEPGRLLVADGAAVRRVPVALEALKLLYDLAFEGLGLTRLYSSVAEDNHGVLRWCRYLGKTEEGRLRGHFFLNGRRQDAIAFGLLAEEYRAVTRPRIDSIIRARRLALAASAPDANPVRRAV